VVPFSLSLEVVSPITPKLKWANGNGSCQAQHQKQPLALKATSKQEFREIMAKCRALSLVKWWPADGPAASGL